MSKFNKKVQSEAKTVSYEGGSVYTKALDDEWANALFSSILQPRFYESDEKQEKRFIELTEAMIDKHDPELIGKAAIFSRNELGMRSVSSLVAAILNKYQWPLKRNFYRTYFHRPDDVGEVFSAIDDLGDKRSHALVRGTSDYLSELSAYQIGKYPMRKHRYNMHDIINITHAKSDVIDKYQKGTLESPDTWEVKIHSLHDTEARETEWKRLVEEHKLGYLALLRNIRNICKCSFATQQWCDEILIPQITNAQAIKRSLVWPLHIYTAWKVLASEGISIEIELALSKAFELSIQNMPDFDGRTLVVLDVSGSMDSGFSRNSNLTIKEVCAVYASAFLSSNFKDNVDFIKFGTTAKWCNPSEFTSRNKFKLIRFLSDNDCCGYGTEISSVFNLIDTHYDRVFLFSDMQVMDSRGYWRSSPNSLWNRYLDNFGKSHMYSFDLGNYSTQVLSQNSKISYITALNDTVFKIIDIQENEHKSLLDIVRDYNCHFVSCEGSSDDKSVAS